MEDQRDPEPIGPVVEEALLKLVDPDLLESFRREKERHRSELKAIEDARKRARNFIWQSFRGPAKEAKKAELEEEYQERVRGENERHAHFLEELHQTVRDYTVSEEPPGTSAPQG